LFNSKLNGQKLGFNTPLSSADVSAIKFVEAISLMGLITK